MPIFWLAGGYYSTIPNQLNHNKMNLQFVFCIVFVCESRVQEERRVNNASITATAAFERRHPPGT